MSNTQTLRPTETQAALIERISTERAVSLANCKITWLRRVVESNAYFLRGGADVKVGRTLVRDGFAVFTDGQARTIRLVTV